MNMKVLSNIFTFDVQNKIAIYLTVQLNRASI